MELDKTILKYSAIHILIITIANAVVSIPIDLYVLKLTWAALIFPFVLLFTCLCMNYHGTKTTSSVILLTFPFASVSSILVTMYSGAEFNEAFRIGFASSFAYVFGCFTCVLVFQWVVKSLTTDWWPAPALSSVLAHITDTYVFFGAAFYESDNVYMAKNWVDLAHGQLFMKMVISLIIFVPLYGLIRYYRNNHMQQLNVGELK